MANHASTKKSIKKTVNVTAINKSRIKRIRTFVKKVESAVLANNQDVAKESLITAQREIMKGVTKNVLKKNTASRKISRLAMLVKKNSG